MTLLLLHLLVIQPPLSTFSAATPERIITNPHPDDCDSPAISLSDSCLFPPPFFPSQPERSYRHANLMVSFPFLEPVACFPLPRGSPCRCLPSLTPSTLESGASWVPGTHPLLSPQDFPRGSCALRLAWSSLLSAPPTRLHVTDSSRSHLK